MGKVGKASNAPGFQRVAAERQKWQELKEQHLTYPWFVKELEDAVKAYEDYLRDQPRKDGEATANLCGRTRKAYLCFDERRGTLVSPHILRGKRDERH